jgi:transcriptional regulator with XRE-family HTH domain
MSTADYEEFVTRLSWQLLELRRESRLTQKEVAERRPNLRQSTVAKFEAGESKNVTLRTVFELSQAYDLPLSAVISKAESEFDRGEDDDHAKLLSLVRASSDQKRQMISRVVQEMLRGDR